MTLYFNRRTLRFPASSRSGLNASKHDTHSCACKSYTHRNRHEGFIIYASPDTLIRTTNDESERISISIPVGVRVPL